MTLSVQFPLLDLRLSVYMMKGPKVVTKDLPALWSADLDYASQINPWAESRLCILARAAAWPVGVPELSGCLFTGSQTRLKFQAFQENQIPLTV